jgi:hypothetical protein
MTSPAAASTTTTRLAADATPPVTVATQWVAATA